MKKKLCFLLCILIGIVSVGCRSEEKQTEKESVVYKIGDTITIDDYAEITFDDLDFRTDTKFGNPDEQDGYNGWQLPDIESDYYFGINITWKNLSKNIQSEYCLLDTSLEYNGYIYTGTEVKYNVFDSSEIQPLFEQKFVLIYPLTKEMYENI